MEKQLKKGLRVTALATNKSAGYEKGWTGVVQRASQSWAVVRWSNGSETMVEPAEIEENLSISDGDTEATASPRAAFAAMPPEMQIEYLSKQAKELQRENERLTNAYCKASEDAKRYKACIQDVYNRLGDSIALRNDKVAVARKRRDEAVAELDRAKTRIEALAHVLKSREEIISKLQAEIAKQKQSLNEKL